MCAQYFISEKKPKISCGTELAIQIHMCMGRQL